MKKYRYWMLLPALALALTGCAPKPVVELEATAEPSAEVVEQPYSPPVITTVEEEDVGEDTHWYYVNDVDGICLAVTPQAAVSSFKFVGLHVEEGENGLQYVIDHELFSVDELTPDKPFVVKMLFVGLMPTYGVTFEDENGQERFYTINAAGTGPEEGYPYYLNEIT